MTIKEILTDSVKGGEFSIQEARMVVNHDWRTLISSFQGSAKREIETLFYFIESFVEEVDEGFVDGANDLELYEKISAVLKKI